MAEPEVVTIPLDQIWANKLPGTKDIRELEPELLSKNLRGLDSRQQLAVMEKTLWHQLQVALCSTSPLWPQDGQEARPAFAVQGTGLEALPNANAVLAKGKAPAEKLSAASDFSMIVFMFQFGARIELLSVARRGREIEVDYRFIQRIERWQTAHLAIIPLGKLPVGEYEVRLVQQPTGRESFEGPYVALEGKPRINLEAGKRFVSKGFRFTVVDE